jgi:hypothetical protein
MSDIVIRQRIAEAHEEGRREAAEQIAQAIEAECGADCYDGPFLTCTHPKDAAIARSFKEEASDD